MEYDANKTVLLTRENNAELAAVLRGRGADVLEIPLISRELGYSGELASDIFETLGSYDWITFSSAHGVKGFFAALFEYVDDIRAIGLARLACVGESTAAELRLFHLAPSVIPGVSNAAAMADSMAEFETLENLKILCVRGNLSQGDLERKLESEYGAIVDSFEVYKTSARIVGKEEGALFRKYGAAALVFSSPSAVDSFAKNAPSLILSAKAIRPKIVTIGPSTSEAVKKLNMKVAASANSPRVEDVADAVMKVLGKK